MAGFIQKRILLTGLAFLIALSFIPVHAQKIERVSRKKTYSIAPTYPEMLKRSNIGGVVRLLIVISPKGTVETVNQLGGNAALVEAAVSAVKKWKYVPAESETTQEVSLTFDPHSYQ